MIVLCHPNVLPLVEKRLKQHGVELYEGCGAWMTSLNGLTVRTLDLLPEEERGVALAWQMDEETYKRFLFADWPNELTAEKVKAWMRLHNRLPSE